jgi:hypothetical protein
MDGRHGAASPARVRRADASARSALFDAIRAAIDAEAAASRTGHWAVEPAALASIARYARAGEVGQ